MLPRGLGSWFGFGRGACNVPHNAVKDVDGLILITEWNKFRRPDFEKLKEAMKTPLIFDGRNIYSRKVLERMGFTYYAIGT